MVGRRFAVAVSAAAALVFSAPFAQQAFSAAADTWPARFGLVSMAATAVPAGLVLAAALLRIRDRRPLRYAALALGLLAGTAWIRVAGLGAGERFHFVEYGLVAFLFYRAWRPLQDGSVLVLPLLAGLVTASLDEWFQWFVPIRAGEARDVLLDAVALCCGLLVAIALDPPERLTLSLRRGSSRGVVAWSAAAAATFAFFFQAVHLGHDIADGGGSVFRSRYSETALVEAGRERAAAWRANPPTVQRRLSREDQYLSEGLWHVRRRNEAWGAGDLFAAWRENLILEKFFAPVLDAPSFDSASGYRWPAAQRADAELRAADDGRPYQSDAQPLRIYAWPGAALLAQAERPALRSRPAGSRTSS
jgi:hypothetical protein